MIRLILLFASLAWPVTRTHQELIDLVGRKGDVTHLYDLYTAQDSMRARIDSLEAGAGGGSIDGAVSLAPSSTTRNLVQPLGATYPGLIIRGHASQSANPFIYQNSAGTALAYMEPDGDFALNRSASGPVEISIENTGAGDARTRLSGSGYNWTHGIDASDFGAHKWSNSNTLGTSDRMKLYPAGGFLVGNDIASGPGNFNAIYNYPSFNSKVGFVFANRAGSGDGDAAIMYVASQQASSLSAISLTKGVGSAGADLEWIVGHRGSDSTLRFYYDSTASSGESSIANAKIVFTKQGHIQLSGGPRIIAGSGSPEGAVTAPIGSLYLRSDGGAGTSMYVKESGTGNTGWVGK
ncbi:MAG TPA: hypothetical protein VK465_08720 [Fibrobacteria bacterium]|nr:hypothetical protein [Fibrobacteria bacterium]